MTFGDTVFLQFEHQNVGMSYRVVSVVIPSGMSSTTRLRRVDFARHSLTGPPHTGQHSSVSVIVLSGSGDTRLTPLYPSHLKIPVASFIEIC